MLRRIAIGFGILLLIPLLGIPLWVALHRTDLPAVNDADLAIAVPVVAPADNGFAHIVRANELSTLVAEDDDRLRALLSGSDRDDVWLLGKLRDNRPALAELETAAPETVFPDVIAAVQTDAIDPLFHSQTLVRLANLDSRRLRANGERAAAVERSLLALRLGAAAMRARNPQLMSSTFAISLQRISLREARLAMAELPLDAGGSLHLSRELERERFAPEAWRRTWAAEYAFMKTTLRALNEQPNPGAGRGAVALLPASFIWQPNRTLASFSDHYRQIARAFAEPCARGRGAFAPADHGELLAEMARGNGLGVTLLSIATPNFEKFNLRRCHAEARLALLEVEVALRAHGAAPDSLDALVPRYLDHLPLDPFDGEPLRYDRARGLVYSVGSDFAPGATYGPPSPDDELEPAIYVPR